MTRLGWKQICLALAVTLSAWACGETGRRQYSQREGKAGRASDARVKDAAVPPADVKPSGEAQAQAPNATGADGQGESGDKTFRAAANVKSFGELMKAGVLTVSAASDTQMLLYTNEREIYYADSRRPEQGKFAPDTPLVNLGKEVGVKPGTYGYWAAAVSPRYLLLGGDDDLRVVELATFRSAPVKAKVAPFCQSTPDIAENDDGVYLIVCSRIYRFKSFSEDLTLEPVATGTDFVLRHVIARGFTIVAHSERGMVVSRDGGKTFASFQAINGAPGEDFAGVMLFGNAILVSTTEHVFAASLGDLAFSSVLSGKSLRYMAPNLLFQDKIYVGNGFAAAVYDTSAKTYKPLSAQGAPRVVKGAVVFVSNVSVANVGADGKQVNYTQSQLFYPDANGNYQVSRAVGNYGSGTAARQYEDIIHAVFDWNGTMLLFGAKGAYTSANWGETVSKWP